MEETRPSPAPDPRVGSVTQDAAQPSAPDDPVAAEADSTAPPIDDVGFEPV